tara:strand:+ start:3899 stop:4315 length:417 start_codon:yes stop_codon:yes gene_type:complete
MFISLENLHSILVHFPIALFSTGLLFDILAKLLGNDEFESASFWIMCTGLISMPFTIASGIFNFLEEGSLIDFFYFQHGILIFISTILLLLLFWARIKLQLDIEFSTIKRNIYLCAHILAIIILFYGAHLGAKTAGRI